MKNNKIIENLKILLLIFIIILSINKKVFSEEFFFEGEEIKVLDNGNRLISDKGVVVKSSDNIILTADKLDYKKLKSEMNLEGNVIIDDINNNTIIKTNKIKYDKKNEVIYTYDETYIDIEKNYSIKSSEIVYYKKTNQISAYTKTEIDDSFGNKISTNEFIFFINDKVLKAKNVKILDINENVTYIKSFFGSLNEKEYFGKDIEVNFNKGLFGNKKNDPRLKGNIFEANEKSLTVSKGIFSTCKKRNGCPPWTLKANKVVHDKEKKIINYHDAWLSVYDKPIIYFPKFFHPDPTVKRQSGFLIPKFSDTSNLGSSLQIPYFKVLAQNKDFTFTPTFFANKDIILQNEYRREEKNYSHIMDFSLFTSAFDEGQNTKTHFFSNTKFDLESSFFSKSDLELNFEQVSNDTYLKKHNIKSPIISDTNLLHSYIEYNGYNDDSYLNFNLEAYENLSKNNNDRYELILPNLNYSKSLEDMYDIAGSLDFTTNIYQKQYDTNKYTQSFKNSLTYNSSDNFSEKGIVQSFDLSVINPNEKTKISSKNESKSKSNLLSKLKYTLSYPLVKQSELYQNRLEPTISYRFSPNKTKNISNNDSGLSISNIDSFGRFTDIDVEGGQSLTWGAGYKKIDNEGTEKLIIDLAQVINEKNNLDLPKKSTLNKKYSDVFGRIKFNTFKNLDFEYNFMLDERMSKSNFSSIKSSLSINNFITSFEYLEENDVIGTSHYIANETTLKFNENNSINFRTRRNREINLTEFYNLVYQYENDCLKAAIQYNKTYYNDADIKPEEEIFFTLTILPYTTLSSTNLK